MKLKRVIEYLIPSIIAWETNRQIRERRKETREDVVCRWEKTFSSIKPDRLAPIVDSIYSSEMERKNAIESKAASLFEGIGFAASLLSIAIVFTGQQPLSLLLFIPMVNFILAGICSWHVTGITKYYLLTLEGIKDDIRLLEKTSKIEFDKHWIIEKLTNIEMNRSLLLSKSNWLSAAHQHFLLGLLLTIPILVVIVYGLLSNQIFAFQQDCVIFSVLVC